MGAQQSIDSVPQKIAFSHGFMYIETDKPVYYPGETIKGSVHILANKPITEAFCLDINETVNVGQYTFLFNYVLPDPGQNVPLPSSFLCRQFMAGRGTLKAKIQYKISAMILRRSDLGGGFIGRFTQRFFVAHKPQEPKVAFLEHNSKYVSGFCCIGNRGVNGIQTQFQRNFYVTDDNILTHTLIDNRQCRSHCEQLKCTLMKTITALGSNGFLFKQSFTIASVSVPGVPAGEATQGLDRALKLCIDDAFLKFNDIRKKKRKLYRPEDLQFAKMVQPTTVGNCMSCTYTLHITRTFSSGMCNAFGGAGISVPITLNPCDTQVNGFLKVIPPPFWNPTFIDCRVAANPVPQPMPAPVPQAQVQPGHMLPPPSPYATQQPSASNAYPVLDQSANNYNNLPEERRPLL